MEAPANPDRETPLTVYLDASVLIAYTLTRLMRPDRYDATLRLNAAH